MSHVSPAVYLVWSLLSCLLGAFLLFHLWSFDRFKCLKWTNGPYSGAFKRAMTYTYLLGVPLVMAFSIGFAIIKYNEGYIEFPGLGVIPKPYELWSESTQRAILPLYLMFSVAWSLEMVTHLEELCFWLFLINAGSVQQDWFRSLYFKTWLLGSVLAVCYMPLVTIFTRSDVLKCEAYTFLAGSLGSLSLTLWFTPILWTFPAFLRSLRRQGVDTDTIVRLTKFHEMNSLRVLFRFLFVSPLLALGIDGVRPHPHVNESMMWTDLLSMIAAIGFIVSSGITLVIFFPRSIQGEIAAKEAAREKRRNRALNRLNSFRPSQLTGGGTYLLTSSPVQRTVSLPSGDGFDVASPMSPEKAWRDSHYSQSLSVSPAPLRPNRRPEDRDLETAIGGRLTTLSEESMPGQNQRMTVNHLVYNFTSPIELASSAYASQNMPMDVLEYNYRR